MSEQAKVEAIEPEQQSQEAAEADEPAQPERGELITPELLASLTKVLPAVWLVGVVVAGYVVGIQVAFLALAAGVLILIITLMWSSVQSLTGGASLGIEEALGMGAPSRVEEQKRAVLRALKDLEYERSVGKISPEDYAELSARYRTEAKRLIQRVDEALGPARAEVEKAIERRLTRAGLTEPAADEKPADEQSAPAARRASAPGSAASDETKADEDEKPDTATQELEDES